jgi:septum formation protein
VLASASPRRRELLAELVDRFDVRPSDVDETLEPGVLEEALARLALRKARAVAADARDGIVLAADTVVVVDGAVLGKPSDPDDARRMLRALRGRVHAVVTAVAVVDAGCGRSETAVVTSRVRMARYDDAAIDRYVASGEPLDKAGAYAIQGLGGTLVDGLAGSYSNVIGLPLAATRRLLEAFSVRVREPVARRARA